MSSKSTIDPKKHKADIQRYQKVLKPRFEVYAKTLEEVLRKILSRHAPLGIVQSRAKSVSSFAEKIIRKNYSDPFVQMTDLCGARLIAITEAEVEAVSAIIKENFEVDYANSLDLMERLGASEFGYRSIHYVVQFRPGKCLGVTIPKSILPTKDVPFKAEIQVRTVLQHGWAEVVHDRIYKNSITVPDPLKRDGARLAALLEEGGGLISRVVENIDAFVVDIGAYMTKDKILEELEKLSLIFNNEKNDIARESLAIRMEKIQQAIAQWRELATLLKPFLAKTKYAALLRKSDQVLCEAESIFGELANSSFILNNEKNDTAREALTILMAKMHRAIAQWCELATLLKPIVAKNKNAALLREYGQALCEAEVIFGELANLSLILNHEKNDTAREALAIRMAKMHRAIAHWPELTALLKPFAAKTKNAALLREYGHALCEANTAKPDGSAYSDGQAALRKSLALDTHCPNTHAALARSYQRQTQEEGKAREHFRNAYHSAPKNPYLFADYVEYELLHAPSSAIIPVLTPVIREAIATCTRHIEVGIELPRAYLTMGKLHLMLGEAYASLDSYAKGLRMILDRKSGICTDCLERELDTLARLNNAQEGLPGDAWARESLIEGLSRMFLLGLFLATGNKKTLDELNRLKKASIKSGNRVLIVAGGCMPGIDKDMRRYTPMLRDTLTGFEGVVVGGGTKAGISGVVGALKSMPNRRFTTLGYYPARMASELTVDKRYDMLIKTDARDFSPLDAIQAWVDITCAGIAPNQVSILGINGGDIAGFEYRLALALGASVGVMVDSGRAADALLKDKSWRKLAKPLGLLDDPMTLRAFINPDDGSVPESKLEALAKAIHVAFCKVDTSTINKRILKDSGQPWGDKLKETFKTANFAQAAYIGEILKTEGYTLVAEKGEKKADNSAIQFTKVQIERMAEKEHGRWNVERLRDGWVPGKDRDDEKKIHDCLVSWAKLPDDIKQYDRYAAQSWPKLLGEIGIKLIKE